MSALKYFICLILLLVSTGAEAALTVDGSNTAANSTTVTITTSSTNDIIVLGASGAVIGGPYDPVTAVSDAAGLTWNHELGPIQVTGSGTNTFVVVDVWWALSPNTLSSDTITVTGNGGNGRLMVMGVNGANTSTPFDCNPGANLGATITSGTSVSIINSTNSTNDMLIEFNRFENAVSPFTSVPSGFTSVLSGGSFTTLYKNVVSSAQSAVTNTFQWSGSSGTAMALVSIQPAGQGGGCYSTFSPPPLFMSAP